MSGQALAIFNLHLLFVGLKFAQADTQQDAEHQAALACYNPNRSPLPLSADPEPDPNTDRTAGQRLRQDQAAAARQGLAQP